MKTATLINEIITSLERLIISIRTLYANIKRSFKKEKNITIKYMTKNIFNWKHISSNLTQDQITELKEYYQTYHRKCWAFKQAAKRFKKWKLLGDTLSVVFATSGIASAIATSGISLVAISTTSVIIQGWMKHKNLELKIQNCTYAYQSYQHLLNAIKDMMRGGDLQPNILHTMMNNIDNHVTDNSPIIDKFLQKYDKIFTYNDPFYSITYNDPFYSITNK